MIKKEVALLTESFKNGTTSIVIVPCTVDLFNQLTVNLNLRYYYHPRPMESHYLYSMTQLTGFYLQISFT